MARPYFHRNAWAFIRGTTEICMTWIVGTVSLFGHSVLVSDIRVTFTDNTEIDCLQKIAPIGEGFICGFAGSIRIGFMMQRMLAKQLPSKRRLPLSLLADDWIPSLARNVFQASDPREKDGGCQILIGTIHPTETLGDWAGHRAFVWKYSWHNGFLPQKLTNIATEDPLHIGSGSDIPAYISAVKADGQFVAYATKNSGFGYKAAVAMHKAVSTKGTKGVSPYMQYGVVSHGEMDFGNCNLTNFDKDGKSTKVEVPRVARTYREFTDFCKTSRWESAGAIC